MTLQYAALDILALGSCVISTLTKMLNFHGSFFYINNKERCNQRK